MDFTILTHDFIVTMASLFAILPDTFSLTLFADNLTLHGDGSYVTSEALSAHLYL